MPLTSVLNAAMQRFSILPKSYVKMESASVNLMEDPYIEMVII
jgi:hypothetical protein